MNLKETLERIENSFDRSVKCGVMIISKSQDEEGNENLVDIFKNYLNQIGYNTFVHEDNEECNISYILKN